MSEATQPNPPRMNARRIYLKDASFESPSAPGVFLAPPATPAVDMNININNQQIDEEGKFFEVVLQVTVNAKHDDKSLYLAEVQQAGIFELHAEDPSHMELLIQIGCPNMLLPFAREELASLVTKGGFAQLLISPINFESVYRQKVAETQPNAESSPSLQ